MYKSILRVGWIMGSGLFLYSAFFLYTRVADIGLPSIGPVEARSAEAVERGDKPDMLELVLDHDGHEFSGDLRDAFAFKALPNATAAAAVSDGSFRVSGLIIGNQPGVVLEDLKSGQTVFLSEGETKDDLALLQVRADGARVRVNGQEFLLAAPREGSNE